MSQNLSERYSVALTHYLAYPDEDVLNQAYELGRKALGDGLGVLDIAMVHHDALHSVISDQSRAKKPVAIRDVVPRLCRGQCAADRRQ
jgi:hypothetical protein